MLGGVDFPWNKSPLEILKLPARQGEASQNQGAALSLPQLFLNAIIRSSFHLAAHLSPEHIYTMKIIIEKHPDGYIAYPAGIAGVVVGQGDTYDEALQNVQSAIRFHIETFGRGSLESEDPAIIFQLKPKLKRSNEKPCLMQNS